MLKRNVMAICAAFALASCATPLNTHPVEPSNLGAPSSETTVIEGMARPGVVSFEKIVAADWHFPNTTRQPGAVEWSVRELDAQIYFYAIRHPQFGLYLIDAGMPEDYAPYVGPILRGVIRDNYDYQLRTSTEQWVREHEAPRGVLVTHLHYDHVLGMAPLSRNIPVYVGPRDGAQKNFFYRFINQPTRETLEGRTVFEWQFANSRQSELAIVDVFGDGSVFAIHVPGHTPGSTAYLVNSTTGPQLVTGDAAHSREGWTGELEEATGFEPDLPQVFASRAALQRLAARIPGLTAHPGHQSLSAQP
jgi:N-acyl homoserine lactone hydrolase